MPEPVDPIERVSTLELFFDLVFVFTITQLTAVLVDDASLTTLGRVALMLGIIWWMYGGYVWLTNAVAADRASRRLLLLGGMAAYLVLALTIPRAFDGEGTAFGVAYLVIVVVHAALFSRVIGSTILRVAPFNFGATALVVLGGAIGGLAQPVLWLLAFLLLWGSSFLMVPEGGFEIGPAHFVERHGLVMIIAIGESVVAIGIGARELGVDAALIGVAVLGLLLSACLWFAYFGGDDERAERALTGASGPRRSVMALRSFGLWHLPLLLGIIGVAFGLGKATGHAFDTLELAPALGLAGGTALFLAGDVGFRHTLALGRSTARAATAPLLLITIPLGTEVAAVAQLAAVVAITSAALLAEARATRSGRVPLG